MAAHFHIHRLHAYSYKKDMKYTKAETVYSTVVMVTRGGRRQTLGPSACACTVWDLDGLQPNFTWWSSYCRWKEIPTASTTHLAIFVPRMLTRGLFAVVNQNLFVLHWLQVTTLIGMHKCLSCIFLRVFDCVKCTKISHCFLGVIVEKCILLYFCPGCLHLKFTIQTIVPPSDSAMLDR